MKASALFNHGASWLLCGCKQKLFGRGGGFGFGAPGKELKAVD